MRVRRATLIRTLVLAGAVAVLELACRTGVIQRFTMIPPSEMAVSLVRLFDNPEVLGDAWQTLRSVFLSLVFSLALGFLIGVVLHAVPRARRIADPLLATYYSVPVFVFYPLLIVLFGLNAIPKTVIGFLYAVVAMVINTLNGLERVRDQQDRRAGLTPQPQQLVAHQEARLLVERAERLVEEDQARLQHERARDAHALAHAARELRRIRVGERAQARELKRFTDQPLGRLRIGPAPLQAERDVVADREPRKARVVLEDDADALRDAALDARAVEHDVALRRRLQSGDDLEQRRLAAARRADDREEFAAAQRQVDRAERMDVAHVAGRREDARDAPDDDQAAVFHAAGFRAYFFDFRSSGRKLSSTNFDQSMSPLTAPTSFCARIMLSMPAYSILPGPQYGTPSTVTPVLAIAFSITGSSIL
jgi:hypothetical protein